jgi:hypothetical protein
MDDCRFVGKSVKDNKYLLGRNKMPQDVAELPHTETQLCLCGAQILRECTRYVVMLRNTSRKGCFGSGSVSTISSCLCSTIFRSTSVTSNKQMRSRNRCRLRIRTRRKSCTSTTGSSCRPSTRPTSPSSCSLSRRWYALH